MPAEFTLKIRRFENVKDRRLGRHVVHDSRSLRYLVRAADPKTLKSIKHFVNIPILDQGDLGSCTGHAGTNALASDAFWSAGATVLKQDAAADHQYAVGLYSDATKLDPWPGQYEPDDTGSDGLSIAKALLTRGLISGYQHATSLEATLTALADRVVMIGSSWLEGMYDPDGEGRLSVNGTNVGGHEYILDELDVPKQRVWMRNSWGPGWGQAGRAWMSWDDLGRLLDDDGDCTVLVPRSEPAPVPAPVPVPTPNPVTPGDDSAALKTALTRFVKTEGCPVYVRNPATVWLKSTSKGAKK